MRGLLGKGVNAECRLRSWEPFENTERPHRPGSQKRQPCRCGLSAPVPQEGTAGRFARLLASRPHPIIRPEKRWAKVGNLLPLHPALALTCSNGRKLTQLGELCADWARRSNVRHGWDYGAFVGSGHVRGFYVHWWVADVKIWAATNTPRATNVQNRDGFALSRCSLRRALRGAGASLHLNPAVAKRATAGLFVARVERQAPRARSIASVRNELRFRRPSC